MINRRRELPDKADGIGKQHRGLIGQRQPPGGGVEGGKEPVIGQDIRPAKGVKQRAFTGVGIADQRHHRYAALLPFLAVLGAALPYLFRLLFEALYLAAYQAAVRLQLGLAGAPGADAAAEPFQVLPLAGQPGEKVLVLGQLHLEAAFVGAGAPGEDIQDERGAVDDFDAQGVFQVLLLDGLELVIEDDDVVIQWYLLKPESPGACPSRCSNRAKARPSAG